MLHAAAAEVPVVALGEPDNEEAVQDVERSGAQDYLVTGQFDGAFLSLALRHTLERCHAAETFQRLKQERALRVQAEAGERRARFLAQVSQILASSAELEATLSGVAHLVAAHAGAACLIETIFPSPAVCVAAPGMGGGG